MTWNMAPASMLGLLLVFGAAYGGDDPSTLPLLFDEGSSMRTEESGESGHDGEDGLRTPDALVVAPDAARSAPKSRSLQISDSITIVWPALDSAAIDEAQEETFSRALVVGLHRDVPPGYKGNLLDDLDWTTYAGGQRARIQLRAEGAASVRVRFRAFLPSESSLTFVGTHNGKLGFPPVWPQSLLASRGADASAIWSPSGLEGELGIIVDVPAHTDLTEHFLVLEKVTHRWASLTGTVSTAQSGSGVEPKHGSSLDLDCPLYYLAG